MSSRTSRNTEEHRPQWKWTFFGGQNYGETDKWMFNLQPVASIIHVYMLYGRNQRHLITNNRRSWACYRRIFLNLQLGKPVITGCWWATHTMGIQDVEVRRYSMQHISPSPCNWACFFSKDCGELYMILYSKFKMTSFCGFGMPLPLPLLYLTHAQM